jgi:hypothetical protein
MMKKRLKVDTLRGSVSIPIFPLQRVMNVVSACLDSFAYDHFVTMVQGCRLGRIARRLSLLTPLEFVEGVEPFALLLDLVHPTSQSLAA